MAKVALLQGSRTNGYSINSLIEHLFEIIYVEPACKVKTVLIKPNLMYYWDASTGETTDPLVVSGIIDCLRKRLGENVEITIVESDASAMRTKHAFGMLGYDQLGKRKGVLLKNLSEGEVVTKEVELQRENIKLQVNSILFSADYIVNVPKLKIHRSPPVLTCALKNFFGLVSEQYKFQYHSMLDSYVAAINKLVKADLTVVDGLTVLGAHPKKMDLIIGSTDNVSCDIVAAKIAGKNPGKDLLIARALKEGLGDPDYQIVDPGAVYANVIRDFPRSNQSITGDLMNLQLKMLRIYAKFSGDIVPPVLGG